MNHRTLAGNPKKIWIDLDNSPHVPFFTPIIRELNKRGVSVVITTRDYAQVIELAELHGLTFRTIGRHYGKNKIIKVVGLLIRAIQMVPFILTEKPSLSVSHGSRAQLLAAGIAGIRAVEADDYEFAKGIPLFKPDFLLVPDPLYRKMKKKSGLIGYPGIKENVYIPELIPDPTILCNLGIHSGEIVISVRPPATAAHYFTSKSAALFSACIDYLLNQPDVRIILLPRIPRQKKEILANWPTACQSRRIIIPDKAVNGLNLIWHSDLVISGGGTMIREAAALNVPAFSIFGGKIGAVDSYLQKTGRLSLIKNESDLKNKLIIKHRDKAAMRNHSKTRTLKFIVDTVESLIM